ncbi:MAG TPA: IS630 family transposase [bacterium]|nr:IS630 family transposase [bacterium]HPM99779.1 IS630 family transposase [bacterium]
MARQSKRAKLQLSEKDLAKLQKIAHSRSEKLAHVQRAQILLDYFEGTRVTDIAQKHQTNRPRVERIINKALQLGALSALDDLHRTGKPPEITSEAKAWFLSIACQKPKELCLASETWTAAGLAQYLRLNCEKAGHPSFLKVSKGTVSKILAKAEIHPERIEYYLERRDPDFDMKMAQVLHVYKEVEVIRDQLANGKGQVCTILSYDEKPGVQAIKNIAAELPPVLGQYPTFRRDCEYKRLGTISILASIDLLTGKVHGQAVDRHRSKEFVEHLRYLDDLYSKELKIKLILDNHSAHISKETQQYLKTIPNRFEFIFTPTHGSWLNMIEIFFSKVSRTLLRHIRVNSKEELKYRITQYFEEINQAPVIFKWKYKMDEITVAF